jgi:hypothetical protein
MIEVIKQKHVIDRMRETAHTHPAALYYYGFVQGTPRVMLDSLNNGDDMVVTETRR